MVSVFFFVAEYNTMAAQLDPKAALKAALDAALQLPKEDNEINALLKPSPKGYTKGTLTEPLKNIGIAINTGVVNVKQMLEPLIDTLDAKDLTNIIPKLEGARKIIYDRLLSIGTGYDAANQTIKTNGESVNIGQLIGYLKILAARITAAEARLSALKTAQQKTRKEQDGKMADAYKLISTVEVDGRIRDALKAYMELTKKVDETSVEKARQEITAAGRELTSPADEDQKKRLTDGIAQLLKSLDFQEGENTRDYQLRVLEMTFNGAKTEKLYDGVEGANGIVEQYQEAYGNINKDTADDETFLDSVSAASTLLGKLLDARIDAEKKSRENALKIQQQIAEAKKAEGDRYRANYSRTHLGRLTTRVARYLDPTLAESKAVTLVPVTVDLPGENPLWKGMAIRSIVPLQDAKGVYSRGYYYSIFLDRTAAVPMAQSPKKVVAAPAQGTQRDMIIVTFHGATDIRVEKIIDDDLSQEFEGDIPYRMSEDEPYGMIVNHWPDKDVGNARRILVFAVPAIGDDETEEEQLEEPVGNGKGKEKEKEKEKPAAEKK